MIEGAIFDYSWTIYHVETEKLYPGAEDLLEDLKNKGIKLALVSRTQDLEKRREDFQRLQLSRYFEIMDIVLTGEVKTFDHILKQFELSPEECLVIGDRIKSEIVEANKIGCRTVWVRQGKFKDEAPESDEEKPDYIVGSLRELKLKLQGIIP